MIYDIVLNFNKEFLDFFEWDKHDILIHVRKIPIFKIKNNINLKNVKKIVNINNKIINKTEIYSKIKKDNFTYSLLLCTEEKVVAYILDIKGNVKVDNIPSQISVSNIPSSIKVENKDNSILDVNIKSSSIALPVKTDSNTQVSVKISDAGSLKTSNQLAVQNMKVNIDESTLRTSFLDSLTSEEFKTTLMDILFTQDDSKRFKTWVLNEVEVSNYKFEPPANNWNSKYQF